MYKHPTLLSLQIYILVIFFFSAPKSFITSSFSKSFFMFYIMASSSLDTSSLGCSRHPLVYDVPWHPRLLTYHKTMYNFCFKLHLLVSTLIFPCNTCNTCYLVTYRRFKGHIYTNNKFGFFLLLFTIDDDLSLYMNIL